jgi:hypothetical protein
MKKNWGRKSRASVPLKDLFEILGFYWDIVHYRTETARPRHLPDFLYAPSSMGQLFVVLARGQVEE